VGEVELCLGENACEEAKAAVTIFKGGEDEGLEIVFGVVHIGKGGVVEAAENTLRLVESAAGKNSDVLKGHGIALLRHDAADLDVAVR
jgi:hypothetical protein